MTQKKHPRYPTKADVEKVTRSIGDKYVVGQKKYGQLDMDTDDRDFLEEVIGELIDANAYIIHEIIRLRRIQTAIETWSIGPTQKTSTSLYSSPLKYFWGKIWKRMKARLSAFVKNASS